MKRNRINITGMPFYAYHGCLEEESVIGGKYRVDVAIECDFSEAYEKDELSATIDYCEVYNLVSAEMKTRSKLIEHVAFRIHKSLVGNIRGVQKVWVKVIKFHPPTFGEVGEVSVEIGG